uniref:Transmembrane protein 91 n=1 Tax=Cyprinus carpio carpio TaxID=630221 RepID=A0A9J7ZAC6_CYPCA
MLALLQRSTWETRSVTSLNSFTGTPSHLSLSIRHARTHKWRICLGAEVLLKFKLGHWIHLFWSTQWHQSHWTRTHTRTTSQSSGSMEEDSSSDDFSDTDSESNFPIMIPQDYLGLAFFSMLCCFWPLGIAAFYLSQKTNKASAQGDFQGASAASRQALWLSVLSIVFGIITYICAIAALISYLSGKPP